MKPDGVGDIEPRAKQANGGAEADGEEEELSVPMRDEKLSKDKSAFPPPPSFRRSITHRGDSSRQETLHQSAFPTEKEGGHGVELGEVPQAESISVLQRREVPNRVEVEPAIAERPSALSLPFLSTVVNSKLTLIGPSRGG